jgi:hypothetical protein
MKWTDQRASKVLEVISSMRVVKYFCYEKSFLSRIFDIRQMELEEVRKIQHNQSVKCVFLSCLFFLLPLPVFLACLFSPCVLPILRQFFHPSCLSLAFGHRVEY